MKFTRWKALCFYPVLLLLVFTFFCTSCQQEASEKKAQPISASGKEQSSSVDKIDTLSLLTQADLFYQLGETFLAANNKDSSLYYHDQALALRETAGKKDKDMFDSYEKVGQFYSKEYKYDVAEKYYEKAQAIVDDAGVPVDDEIRFLLDLSFIKLNLKDTPTSVSILNRLISFVQLHRPNDTVTLGDIHHSLCNAYYYNNQFDLAIQHAKLAISYSDLIKDNLRVGIAYTTIGMIYHKMNQNRNALDSYRKSIQKHLKWTDPESDELAKVYLQKAFAHRDLSEFDSAQYYLQWNLKIRRSIYGEKDPNTFGAKLSLGQFYESIHSYDSAVTYSHESLISLVKDFNAPDFRVNPIADPTELNIDLVNGLVAKGKALKLLSESDPSRDCFKLALSTYLLADSVFSGFRRNLKYDDPQLRELEAGHIPYNQMIELAFHLFQKTGENKYIKVSIDIMEQSRAVLLESALNRAQEYDVTGSHIFKNQENELITQRMEILRQLSMTDLSKSTADSLNETLLSVNRAFAEWKESIEQTNPGYFNLRYNQKGVSLDEIQTLLKERNSLFLEYLWSDEKIYTLAISPLKIETKVILQTDSFKKSFDDFITQLQATPDEAIKLENFNRFSQSAFTLYNFLIRDVLPNDIERNRNVNLIISANGPLATVPFEALITKVPQSNDVNYRLPYLIQNFPISYAYSPGTLINQSKRGREGNKLLALGFAGNGTSRTQRNGLHNLPGTEKEINSIKAVMKNNTNTYYLESEASEAMFKKQVTDFDIVHLAIHGIADSANALKSKLVFRSEADTLEDSNLYAHELYTLNLEKLDLAVLSACESGIGKQQTGEGLMSIARGFAYAGCPSLVISLWKIDDGTSAQVMSNFYKYVSEGEPLDKSLANAKADYIEGASEFNSHPSYWAAFLQVGDTRAIDNKKIISKFWIIVLIIVSFISLIVVARKFIRQSNTIA